MGGACKNAVLSQARRPSAGNVDITGGGGGARGPPADAPVISLSSRDSFLRDHGVDNAVQYFYSFRERRSRKKRENREQCQPLGDVPPSENECFVTLGCFQLGTYIR